MGTRKRHSVTLRSPTQGGPRRYQSGAVRIDDRVRLGHALAMALEPFGLGVAVVEPGTLRVTFASEALGALLGATVDQLTGLSSLRERVMPADVAAAEACLGATRASESTIHFLHSWGNPVELESQRPSFRQRPERRERAAPPGGRVSRRRRAARTGEPAGRRRRSCRSAPRARRALLDGDARATDSAHRAAPPRAGARPRAQARAAGPRRARRSNRRGGAARRADDRAR